MNKTLDIIAADSAGSVTLFVLTPCSRHQYKDIAQKLLSCDEYRAEQVAFVLPPTPNVHGKMEMSGLEFCGNSARAFALMVAEEMNIIGEGSVVIDVSGYEGLLEVQVNTTTNYTKTPIPRPHIIKQEQNGMLIDFKGILHLVLWDIDADKERFLELKENLMERFAPPALGVMFFNTETQFLTPVVYVAALDSTCFEGSCATGTAAVAVALSHENKNGIFTYNIQQPSGRLTATLLKNNGQVESLHIEGPVALEESKTLTL